MCARRVACRWEPRRGTRAARARASTGPDALAMVRAAAPCARREDLDRLGPELTAPACRRRGARRRRGRGGPRGTTATRYAEPGLAACEDLGRQIAAKARRSAILPVDPLDAQVRRQTERELGKLVVEERRAELERVAIEAMSALKSRSSGQVPLDVDELEARDPGGAAGRAGRRPLEAAELGSASGSRVAPGARRGTSPSACRSAASGRARRCRGSGLPGTAPNGLGRPEGSSRQRARSEDAAPPGARSSRFARACAR